MLSSKALTAAEKQRCYHQRHSQLQKNNDAIIKGTHSCRKTTMLSSKALTAAEKQRCYRQRRNSNQEKRAEFLSKCRQKYQLDKQLGKRKSIQEMTERAQRHQRKVWRQQQQDHRRKLQNEIQTLTPPNLPTTQYEIPMVANPGPSRQRTTEKKIQKRMKNKCFKDNVKLQQHVDMLSKRVNVYKQRWLKEKVKTGDKLGIEDTPRTKTRKLLRNFVSKKTKKNPCLP